MSQPNMLKIDLYGLLEINIDATEADIRRAYRKKALKCHPDKNPDNPDASKLFHELSKALEILTDCAARTAYDKLLKAKQATELRNQLLDSKRKKLKEDLEQREQNYTKNSSNLEKYADSFEKECNRLRQEASKILEEEQKILNDRLKQTVKDYNNEPVCDSTQCRLKIKWKSEGKDPCNGGYTNDILTRFLNKYGDIIAIVMSKKNGSAMVEFKTLEAAQMAFSYEKGLLENPLKLEWVSPPTTLKTNSCTESIYDNEDLVLRKLRQAEERKILIEQMQKEDENNECSLNISSTDVDIKPKLITGEYTLTLTKRGSSKVWELFGTIKDENGTELQNLVACKKCYKVMKLHSKSTSNLIKHKCFLAMKEKTPKMEVDSDTKKEVTRVVTAWTVHNCRSFKIIEDSGLKKFAELMLLIGARHGENVDIDKLLPDSSTISGHIDNLYNICSGNIKLELSDINNIGYALTSDVWIDNYIRASYVTITIYFIKESTLVKRLIGVITLDFEPCTNYRILPKVQQLLKDFNCDLNNAITVTDRRRKMLDPFRTNDHISCINQLLHNVIEKSIQAVSILNQLCNKCAKLVKYFKKSGINTELANNLKSFTPTHWITAYYLLNSIEDNWINIGNTLRTKNQLHRIDGINISLVTAVSKVLQFFEETSKKLEGDTCPTLHLVIPHVYRLKRLCAVSNEDCEITKAWKDHLNVLLETTVVNNLTIFHKIALFLYPPTNKLAQFSFEEKNSIKNECERIMSSYTSNTFTNQSKDNSAQIHNETSDLFSAFMDGSETSAGNEEINIEIQSYENIKGISPNNFDVLQWWYTHRLQYPLLYKLSCKIFATPATSASSEKVFSNARNLISEKHTNSSVANKILFLKSNMDTSQMYNLIN